MHTSALELLDRFYRYVATERQLSPNTSDAYRHDLIELVAFCDREKLESWDTLGAPHIRVFAARSHARGLSPASVARRLSAVRTFMRFLIREHAIGANPAVTIQAPKGGRPLPRVLDPDQMAQLLAIKGEDPLTVRDRAIMELAYSSALRLAELVRLNVGDVDLADRTVRVFGKGNVERIVPVGSYAAKAIGKWLRLRTRLAKDGESALLVGRSGARLTGRNIQLRIAARAREQRLPVHVHPHMFRHSAATHFLEGCGDIRVVQEFLGHVSISTTQIYTHLDFAHIARVYDAAHPRGGMNPAERAKRLPKEPLPDLSNPRRFEEALGPSPCDDCPHAAHCAAEHLACEAFEIFCEGLPKYAWRSVSREGATAERYQRLDM